MFRIGRNPEPHHDPNAKAPGSNPDPGPRGGGSIFGPHEPHDVRGGDLMTPVL